MRHWLIAAAATLALFLGLRELPLLLPGERVIGGQWNWSGQLLALAGVLWAASMLARRAGLPWREMGFSWIQRPGSLRATIGISAVALLLNLLLMRVSHFRLADVQLETWLYQATLPGLVEESVFRGVLLAMLDRAFTARKSVLGASLGWGGALVTFAFLGLHRIGLGTLLGVLPAALLYLWLRARTGSLVLPITVHNLWNLSVYAAHL